MCRCRWSTSPETKMHQSLRGQGSPIFFTPHSPARRPLPLFARALTTPCLLFYGAPHAMCHVAFLLTVPCVRRCARWLTVSIGSTLICTSTVMNLRQVVTRACLPRLAPQLASRPDALLCSHSYMWHSSYALYRPCNDTASAEYLPTDYQLT